MKTQYAKIVTSESITIMKEGELKPRTVRSTDTNFIRIRQAVFTNDLELAYQLCDRISEVKRSLEGTEFSIENGVIRFGNFILNNVVCSKLLNVIKDGSQDLAPIGKYINRILDNPSRVSANELYDFLGYRELPITPDGMVLAFKGVREDYWSCSGNKSTVVLQGEVNDEGQILNNIGEVIEVKRICVDDDRSRGCSTGLHVGSYNYARDWGQRLLLVMFDPADAVSVPEDCSYQKLRVCKYQVIADITDGEEITDPIVDENEFEVRVSVNRIEDEDGEADKDELEKARILVNMLIGKLKYNPSITKDCDFIYEYLIEETDLSLDDIKMVIEEERDEGIPCPEEEVGGEGEYTSKDPDPDPNFYHSGADAIRTTSNRTIEDKIYNYLRGRTATLKQIQSCLKINGLGCEDIATIVKNDNAYVFTRNDEKFSDSVVEIF
jgi:hypothetical protein